MFIQGTLANELNHSFQMNYTFESMENQDVVLLQIIEKKLETLTIDNLEMTLKEISTLYHQILGTYDEKLMIDGQIYTLTQLVQLQSNIQNQLPLDQDQLNMLYLSIYRFDQQLQIDRFTPIIKELTKNLKIQLTHIDLADVLPFDSNMTGQEFVTQLVAKYGLVPQNEIEKVVKNQLMIGVNTKQAIEEEVQATAMATEQILQRLKTSKDVTEWVELLLDLPIDRYHNTSLEVKEMVVEKVMDTIEDFTFANIQKQVILETLRAEKRIKDEFEANREKTLQEKLMELAETDASGEKVMTELTL
jgi:hypothetical protein